MVLKPLSGRGAPIGVFRRQRGFYSCRICLVREKCIERYSKGVSIFFDGFDARDSVSVLNSACVAAQQPSANFNVTLTEVPRPTKLSEPAADFHNGYYNELYCVPQVSNTTYVYDQPSVIYRIEIHPVQILSNSLISNPLYWSSGAPNFSRSDPQIRIVKISLG